MPSRNVGKLGVAGCAGMVRADLALCFVQLRLQLHCLDWDPVNEAGKS